MLSSGPSSKLDRCLKRIEGVVWINLPCLMRPSCSMKPSGWVDRLPLLHILIEFHQVSMFPEGRINVPPPNFNPHITPSPLRPFRWGVGRVLTLTEHTPTILPIHLTGFNDVFVDGRPYTAIPSFNADITVDVGDPIQYTVDPHLNSLRNGQGDEIETRKQITDILRQELDTFGKVCDIRNYDMSR